MQHIAEDHFLWEVVDPETGEPVPEGAHGRTGAHDRWTKQCHRRCCATARTTCTRVDLRAVRLRPHDWHACRRCARVRTTCSSYAARTCSPARWRTCSPASRALTPRLHASSWRPWAGLDRMTVHAGGQAGGVLRLLRGDRHGSRSATAMAAEKLKGDALGGRAWSSSSSPAASSARPARPSMSKTCARSRQGAAGGRFRGLVATCFAESRLCTCGTAAHDGGPLHRCVPLLASLVRCTVSCFWIEQEQCPESAARGLRRARPAWGRLMRKTNLRDGAGYRTRTSATTQLPGSLRRKKSIYCLGSRFVYGFAMS